MSEDIIPEFSDIHIFEENMKFIEWRRRSFNESLKHAEIVVSTELDPIHEYSKTIIGIIGMGSIPELNGIIRKLVIEEHEREIFIIGEKNIVRSPTLPDCSGIGRSMDNLRGTFKLSAEAVEKLRDSFTYAKSKKKRTKNNRKHSKRR